MFRRRTIARISGSAFGVWIAVYYFYISLMPKSKSVEELRELVKRLNEEQTIYNLDKFGPVKSDTIIISVQVHSRLLYLNLVIESLSKARGIQTALLIFSHDWYDEEINALVRSIKFAMVMQIFYPFSVQLHPTMFPGHDPYYCEDEELFSNGTPKECYIPPKQNRNADWSQIKHHWWWKANSIFSRLECTANHTGLVVFMEDDHYVLQDFLHTLRLLRATADHKCPQCEMVSLGTLTFNFVMRRDAAKVQIKSWLLHIQNMGIAVNRTFWKDIVRMQKAFCRHNDFNWDMSLLHMSSKRLKKGPFKVLTVKAPRIFHIGKCGVHFQKSDCDHVALVQMLGKMSRACRRHLFPKSLRVVDVEAPPRLRRRPAGWWKDRRDRELCRNMTKMRRRQNF